MPVQSYLPVLNIVQEACRQMSILVPAGVYGSQDENAELMGSVINNIGQMLLANRRCMQQFRQPLVFTGDGLRKAFDVPANYGRLINTTGWSYSLRRPVRLATPQEWNALLAWTGTGAPTFQPIYRLINDQFTFLIAPAVGEKIQFEYVLNTWIIDGNDSSKRKQYCNVDADMPMFDSLLMILATKVAWRSAKGFDNTADTTDFNDRLDQVYDADVPGEVLVLGQGGAIGGTPLLSGLNLPNTGYGL